MATDFEAPLVELQGRIDELEKWPGDGKKEQEARRLRGELDTLRRDVYSKLTPWQKTLVARNPNRPRNLRLPPRFACPADRSVLRPTPLRSRMPSFR